MPDPSLTSSPRATAANLSREGVPIIRPLHHDVGRGDIRSVIVAPDGTRVYFHEELPAIDLVQLAFRVWPEALAVVLFLCLLLLVLRVIRCLRFPQRAGKLYCPRCNYDLTGQTDPKLCTECGGDLTSRPARAGRGFSRRVVPSAVPFVAMLVAYGALHAWRVPRTGVPAEAMTLRSPWLYERLALNGVPAAWWRPITQVQSRVQVFDVRSRSVRTLFTWNGSAYVPIELTPDQSQILLLHHERGTFRRYDARSGRPLGQAPIPGHDDTSLTQFAMVIGFVPGTSTAVLLRGERYRPDSGELALWDCSNDAMIPIGDGGLSVPRSTTHRLPRGIDSSGRLVTVVRTVDNRWQLLRIDRNEYSVRSIPALSNFDEAVISPDATWVLAGQSRRAGRLMWLDTATAETRTAQQGQFRASDRMLLAAEGSLLFERAQDHVDVWRPETPEKSGPWRLSEALRLPSQGLHSVKGSASADGRIFAASVQHSLRRTGSQQRTPWNTLSFRHELVIWDRSTVEHPAPPTTSPQGAPAEGTSPSLSKPTN